MSTESYIRDKRFEVHGAAIKWQDNIPARWYDARQLELILKQEDWSDVLLICHHANFDGFILSHHYDITPKMYGCTMSMARLLFPTHVPVSLESVRERLGFSPKRTPYHLFRGKHWNELDRQTQETLAEGCEDEAESIWQIFKILSKDFPAEEYETIDSLIRMFVNPVLRADTALLAELWESEAKAKGARIRQLGITEADVQSANKFQALLEAEGIKIRYKPNPKGEMIPAFAKSDDFMQELLEHANERVRTLAEARIGAKSTLLQTRAEHLGFMSQRGPLCVYLRYCGAATLRPTGGDGCLTADTRVLVFDHQRGLTEKWIVDILLDDLIWDGEEFVAHGGVAFRGYKEVIEHDGVEGTFDHVVFCQGTEIGLAEAALRRTPILDCRPPTDSEVDAVARGRYQLRSVPLSVWHRKAR